MRMLLILLMAAALAAGGFLTRPDEAAHRANADKVLGERRGGFDVGDLIDDVLGSALNERKFEDMLRRHALHREFGRGARAGMPWPVWPVHVLAARREIGL